MLINELTRVGKLTQGKHTMKGEERPKYSIKSCNKVKREN